MKKILCSAISIIVAIFLLITNVYAHGTAQNTQLDTYQDENGFVYVGSEEIGWGIMEFCHLGTHQGQYKFDSGLDSQYRTMFLDAVELWSSTTQATMTQSNSAIGTVVQGNYGEGFVARAVMNSSYSSGHITSWEIQVNTYYANSITVMDLAHEIGHIWGLTDLRAEDNVCRLMYYSNASTATSPTTGDINGFKVITGLHTTHNWIYTNARKKCTLCHGIKTESHSYLWSDYSASQHRGVCSMCGKTVYESHETYYNAIKGCVRCLRKTPIHEIMSLISPDNRVIQKSGLRSVLKE